MNTIATFIVALILLSAAGLVTWVWFAMAHVEEELRFFSGFEGMHFESGAHSAQDAVGAK